MTILTAGNLTNLRTTQHRSEFFLVVVNPQSTLTAQIDDASIERGARDIVYDGGAGDYTLVTDGMLLWIGTAAGLNDKGIERVKSITGSTSTGTITIDENGRDFEDDDYLTVVDNETEPWRVMPRIDLDTSIWKKFYGTNFTWPPGPVCIAGPSIQYQELVDSSAVFNFDLSDSYAIAEGAAIDSYILAIAPTGPTINFNTTTGIGTITVTSVGQWTATCTAADDNLETQERILIISTVAPLTGFSKVKITEQLGRGVQANLSMDGDDATIANLPTGALVGLFHNDYFDGISGVVSVLGLDYPEPIIGYVDKVANKQNLQRGDSDHSLTIISIDKMLARLPMNSVTVEAKGGTPTVWYHYASWLTVGRAIHHLLRWHTNILTICDVKGLMDNQQYIKESQFEAAGGQLDQPGSNSILAMINNLTKNLFSVFQCDRVGRIHLVDETQLMTDRTALDEIFEILPEDVSGTIDYPAHQRARMVKAMVSGFFYNQTSSIPYVAMIPGYVDDNNNNIGTINTYGISHKHRSRSILDSQDDANKRAGRDLAKGNLEIQEIRFTCSGDYSGAFTTIGSYGMYSISDLDDILNRGTMDNINLICHQIISSVNSKSGETQTSVILHPEAIGPDGIKSDFPTSLPDADWSDSADEAWDEDEEGGLQAALAGQSSLYRDDDDTTWEELQAQAYNCVRINEYWRHIAQSNNPQKVIWWGCGDEGLLHWVTGKNGTPETITLPNPFNTWSDATAPVARDLSLIQIQFAWPNPDLVATPPYNPISPYSPGPIIILAERQGDGDKWRGEMYISFSTQIGFAVPTPIHGTSISTETRPIWATINGEYILVTVYEDNNLKLLVFGWAGDFVEEVALGGATLDELARREFVAYPQRVLDDDEVWHIYGRFDAPIGLTGEAGIKHIVISEDGGSTYSDVDNDLGAIEIIDDEPIEAPEYIGSAHIDWSDASTREYIAYVMEYPPLEREMDILWTNLSLSVTTTTTSYFFAAWDGGSKIYTCDNLLKVYELDIGEETVTLIGQSTDFSPTVPTQSQNQPKICYFGGTLFVAYMKETAGSNAIHIYSYDGTAGNWTQTYTSVRHTGIFSTAKVGLWQNGSKMVYLVQATTGQTNGSESSTDGTSWAAATTPNGIETGLENWAGTQQGVQKGILVGVNTAASEDILEFDGTNWANALRPISGSGITDFLYSGPIKQWSQVSGQWNYSGNTFSPLNAPATADVKPANQINFSTMPGWDARDAELYFHQFDGDSDWDAGEIVTGAGTTRSIEHIIKVDSQTMVAFILDSGAPTVYEIWKRTVRKGKLFIGTDEIPENPVSQANAKIDTPYGMSVTKSGDIFLGNSLTASGTMIERATSGDGYATWEDITDNISSASPVTSIDATDAKR